MFELPLTKADFRQLLEVILSWARKEQHTAAVLLVGSYARGMVRVDSDLDIVVVTDDQAGYFTGNDWPFHIPFGDLGLQIVGWRDAVYGDCWSRHLRLSNGLEVEIGFVDTGWLCIAPMKEDTAAVLRDGYSILLDPRQLALNYVRCMR